MTTTTTTTKTTRSSSDAGDTQPEAPEPLQSESVQRKAGTVRLRIRRQTSPQDAPVWQEFEVPLEPGANVISCLQQIAATPVTVDGRKTTPVVYDAGCLEEVCGSCTMLINGKVRQACSALIKDYISENNNIITLEPMSKFPVVRDLMVNRDRLFHALKLIRGWVPIDGTYDLGPGPKATPAQQQRRYKLSTCMSCGCCLEACPQYVLKPDPDSWDRTFIGVHAVAQTELFNRHETGAALRDDRLTVMEGRGGVSDCGNAQNCVQVCPKEIPLTEALGVIGRAVTIHSIKKFFSDRTFSSYASPES